MSAILSYLKKPSYLSLLIGIMMGTMTYYVGRWTLQPSRQAAEQEITLITKDLKNAFLLAHMKGSLPARQRLMNEALKKATDHPRLISAIARRSDNTLLGVSQKSIRVPSYKLTNMTFPVGDGDSNPLGLIELKFLSSKAEIIDPLLRRIRWYALFALFLGFFACFSLTRKSDDFLPRLTTMVKKVSAGNLDGEIPLPQNKDYAELAKAFNKMTEGLKERDRMRHSLGRIMDPKIAEVLIKEDPRVGGLRREATILFCDIRNYTSLCEDMGVDELQRFLNEYWKGTVEIIMEQEGTIDKFHGDGVCVVYGAPTLHRDDPVRAVRTAWRLIKNVEMFNKHRELERKIPIEIGIGVHSGEVIAGHIGSERRMDYTVVGDVVNVAARMEEFNKKFGTQILISDAVYEQVEPYVRVKTLTLAHLRGHKRPILVHTVRDFIEIPEGFSNRKAA